MLALFPEVDLMNRTAFSLVELSIVLVILGLLTGGILAGQSLIHAAELRAVSTEYNRYYSAAMAFRDKYFMLPGDFNNAQAFWGQSTSCGGAAATGTCNGNADGQIGPAAALSTTGEDFQFWNQLALAGLIEGTYTGVAGSGGPNHSIIGTNVPKSKLNTGGWGAYYTGKITSVSTTTYQADYGNELFFGAATATTFNTAAVFKPEDAWNLDTKMDDGKPGTGKILAYDAVGFTNTGSCTTSANNTDYTGAYNLSSSTLACSLFFVRLF